MVSHTVFKLIKVAKMKDSQLNMKEHSQAKIELLSRYMDRFLNIMNQTSHIHDVYLYDLFCGEGIYPNGGTGSPIIFLEKIKNLHFANKVKSHPHIDFHCFFNDLDENKLKKLKTIIEDKKLHYEEMGSLKITNEDYLDKLEDVVNNIEKLKRSEKAFVFIDPYGYKEIKAGDIKRLIYSKKSEVLLFLPTQNMFRFEKKSTPKSLVSFITELVPEDEWPESETGLDFIETLLGKFRGYLGPEYFVDSFIITRSTNQYFCLFFFTSHIRGFEKMLEAKWKIDEEEGRSWKQGIRSDLFADQEKVAKTNKLRSALYKFLETARTNGELYEFGLSQGFLTKHINSILKEFQKNHEIEVKKEDGSSVRKGAFYVNYKKYKNNPTKIKVIKRS
mgnify:CR=1 FL=1